MSSRSELGVKFQRFIEQCKDEDSKLKYELELSALAVKSSKSLVVDFNDLYLFNPELAIDVIKSPQTTLTEFGFVALEKLKMRDPAYSDEIKSLKVRIRQLPESIPLRGLTAKNMGKLIMLGGIVVKMSKILPFIIKSSFKCGSCGELISIDQDDETLLSPRECPSCGSRKGFTMKPEESVFVDSQLLVIQESQEKLPAGMLPTQIVIALKEDLVDTARPGDLVSVTGKMALQRKIVRGGISRKFEFNIEANNVEISSKEGELIEITPDEELKIIELSRDPLIANKLLRCIAPSLYGLEVEKEACLYHLFGGVREEREDITIRGDINILFVGDPGTGKTQLQQYIINVAPRGIFTTGKGSSAAGLTAAVIKDEKMGGFTLEAGALVLGDLGHVAIDELDKMREEDRGSMHTAMEQQIVPIAKGGIVATLNARTAITASANPTLGRWNSFQTVLQNISTFPIPLLNRFDLIFVMKDLPNPLKDDSMAEYVLTLVDGGPESTDSPIEKSLLRKYIAYARANVKPKITDEVRVVIKDFYKKMRKTSGETTDSAISITIRQLESTVRIAKARAKIHLRHEVTLEDAQYGIQLMKRSLEQVGLDPETGEIDIDLLYSGKPRSLQIKLQTVLGEINKYNMQTGEPINDDDLFDFLFTEHKIGRTEAAKLIGTLMRDGTIFSPRPGTYRRTG